MFPLFPWPCWGDHVGDSPVVGTNNSIQGQLYVLHRMMEEKPEKQRAEWATLANSAVGLERGCVPSHSGTVGTNN